MYSQSNSVMLMLSHWVMSNSLRPHRQQHTRLFCPSLSPRIFSNLCPLSQWYHPTISSSVIPLLILPSIFPSSRGFSSESALHIRWPKYWSFSFSISPSSEYSGPISFRMNWLDLPAVQGTQEAPSIPQFKSINSSARSFLYGSTLTYIHDYWKIHSLD